jgi:MFS family permease
LTPRGTTFFIGPFLGPALAGYIGAGSNWKVSFGILTAFYALSTILIFLFGHETYYTKGQPCQLDSRLQSMFGIRNHNLPVGRTLVYWTKILAIYIFKLPLLLTGIATMVNFCWPIGEFCFLRHKGIPDNDAGITVTVSTLVAQPPYLFNTVQSASLRWAPIIGSLLGEQPARIRDRGPDFL